jgi:predicted lipoprotein with Yx(FWY)xxD motif
MRGIGRGSAWVVTVVAVAALGLAACASDDPSAGGGGGTGEGDTSAPTVQAGSSELGDILVDADGRTLYLFENDTDGKSTCYDDCATNWPALIAEGDPVAGDGVDASQLGTTERTDGTQQVTYAGQPLYHFAGDEAPGDTNGQEIGDVWYVVSPDGSPVEGEHESEHESEGGDEDEDGSKGY